MIRPARPGEAEALTDLALRSKAYWGYDAAFMAACRAELTVTPAQAASGLVQVYEEGGRAFGFYLLEVRNGSADVAMLFVEPAAIGRGIGRALWQHLVAEARRLELAKVTIESDPNAEAFYRAMGATTVGTAPSASIPGRRLALMELALGEDM
ncbi:MAG: GNAT family N-acetyltransferase [Alphaproteobacteria bacterium]|nr:GNAT family N-acetyltransferase [Alphaproteobacteria bacterium]